MEKESKGKAEKRKMKRTTTPAKDTVTQEPRKKRKEKRVGDTLQEKVDNNEDREIEQEIKTRFSVKRDWEGIPNYFPSNTKFEMFFPVDMEEQEKIKWVDAVFKRKQEIESKITDIFGGKEAVKLVRYGNRVRLRFPCLEKGCSFSTVDMVKHLSGKHKCSKEETLLQTSYYHCLHDYITKMKTYFLNKPCLCFTCARVFGRIDCHISAKHAHRGSEEYEILKKYRE